VYGDSKSYGFPHYPVKEFQTGQLKGSNRNYFIGFKWLDIYNVFRFSPGSVFYSNLGGLILKITSRLIQTRGSGPSRRMAGHRHLGQGFKSSVIVEGFFILLHINKCI